MTLVLKFLPEATGQKNSLWPAWRLWVKYPEVVEVKVKRAKVEEASSRPAATPASQAPHPKGSLNSWGLVVKAKGGEAKLPKKYKCGFCRGDRCEMCGFTGWNHRALLDSGLVVKQGQKRGRR
jgi:hypothetical protein